MTAGAELGSGEAASAQEPLVVHAEGLPDEVIDLQERLEAPAPEEPMPASPDVKGEGDAGETGKPVKKVRRLWWRKRAGRSRSASGGGSTGSDSENS